MLLKVYAKDSVAPSTLTPGLTSQSFRRGAAQCANANPALSAQWIGDRGGWQMSGISKAFAYIFNTTKEDQKVAKHLNGWEPEEEAQLPHLSHPIQQRLLPLKTRLFPTCLGFTHPHAAFTVDGRVADVFLATALMHLNEMVEIAPHSLNVHRGMARCEENGVFKCELQAVSSTIKAEFRSRIMS